MRFKPELETHAIWCCPAASAEGISPFWFLSASAEEAKCNLEWVGYWVSIVVGADYVGKVELAGALGRAIPRRLTVKSAGEDGSEVIQVWIPALANAVALPADEELRFFRAAPAKRAAAAKSEIAISGVQKRVRKG